MAQQPGGQRQTHGQHHGQLLPWLQVLLCRFWLPEAMSDGGSCQPRVTTAGVQPLTHKSLVNPLSRAFLLQSTF